MTAEGDPRPNKPAAADPAGVVANDDGEVVEAGEKSNVDPTISTVPRLLTTASSCSSSSSSS